MYNLTEEQLAALFQYLSTHPQQESSEAIHAITNEVEQVAQDNAVEHASASAIDRTPAWDVDTFNEVFGMSMILDELYDPADSARAVGEVSQPSDRAASLERVERVVPEGIW